MTQLLPASPLLCHKVYISKYHTIFPDHTPCFNLVDDMVFWLEGHDELEGVVVFIGEDPGRIKVFLLDISLTPGRPA